MLPLFPTERFFWLLKNDTRQRVRAQTRAAALRDSRAIFSGGVAAPCRQIIANLGETRTRRAIGPVEPARQRFFRHAHLFLPPVDSSDVS